MIINDKNIPIAKIELLDTYYKMYKSEMNVEKIADNIETQITARDFVSKIPLMKDWNIAKNYVFPRIVNAYKNAEYLKYVPNRKFLDMSVVYYKK